MQRSESVGGWRISPVKAHCLRPRYGGGRGGEEESGKLKSVAGGLELTRLASSELEHRELNVMGFCLGIGAREGGGEGGGGSGVTLELKTWLDGSIRKTDFIRRG